MAFMLSDITNQKSVKVFLGEGERDAVMLGIKYVLLDDERWGELVDSLTPPKVNEDDPDSVPNKFIDTLRRYRKAIKEICNEVVVQSETGLQMSLRISVTDDNDQPLRDESGKRITKLVEANLKKGDLLEGEAWDAFTSFMPVAQQVFDFYSKHCQNVHQRDKDKKK